MSGTACHDTIRDLIEGIPADIPKLDLSEALESVIEALTSLDPHRTLAYLDFVKIRFGLKVDEVKAYERTVNERRKRLREKERGPGAPETIYTADLPNLVDIVEADGEPAFLLMENGELSVMGVIEQSGTIMCPPPIEGLPWLLPRAEEAMKHFQSDSDAQLFKDLIEYHKSISELPTERHYILIAAWDFHTYMLEPVQYSPVIWLYAVPERGKSRTGKGMLYVAYRGIHVESLRDAYLIRVAQNLKATLFIDVMDLWKKAEREGSEDVLLLRFEKGAKVPRVLYPERGAHQDTVYYSVFGPTIVGTNEPIHAILETRSVPLTLPLSARKFEMDLTPEMGRGLRERLVAYRARHLGEALPEVSKPAPGRLGDILKPLLQVVLQVAPGHETELRMLFLELQQARLVEKAESLESRILVAIHGLESEVAAGILSVKAITDSLNVGKTDKEKLTYQRVGRRLGALGFRKGKTGANGSAIIWDAEHLRRTMVAYGLTETPDSPPSGQSESESAPPTDDPPKHQEKHQPVSPCDERGPGVSGVSGVSEGVQEDWFTQSIEEWEERAAILEHDAGLPRADAEDRARREASARSNGVAMGLPAEAWQLKMRRRGGGVS